MPLLAVSFLVMGLACMGFPGTVGFIGHEMLLDGALGEFPLLGFCVIGAGAFTGVAVLRMYFSLFCGRRDGAVQLGSRPRETLAFAALATVLLGLGVAPAPLVSSGIEAGRQIMSARARADAVKHRGELLAEHASLGLDQEEGLFVSGHFR
jgi:NADH-quinone oxidoreductase subunit M